MGELTGFTVVITRPEPQSRALAQMIRDAGGNVISFPVLAIADTTHPERVQQIVANLHQVQLAIFISANAVQYGLRQVSGWPANVRVAAVGAATAAALREHGHTNVIAPTSGFNSEALLALPELNAVRGQRVVIFRGEGGRELLADTLRARGAQVDYAEVYRRVKLIADATELMAAWSQRAVDAIVVTSNEVLQNLLDVLSVEGQRHLRNTQLLVTSMRAADLARELGIVVPPRVVSPVSDTAIFNALVDYAKTRHA